jgi:hypothetical protein
MTMTAHSDDTRIAKLLAPLGRLESVPFARPESKGRRWLQKPVLVTAVATLALALTGVAIADGLGAFDGITAAQHPQSAADALDPASLAFLQRSCSGLGQAPFYTDMCHLIPDSTRLVGQLPSGLKVFVLAATRGDLCVLVEDHVVSCGRALSASSPTTDVDLNDTGNDFVTYGVARDGVTAVSFIVDGQQVTVPVKDNVWAYEERSTAGDGKCLTVHYADGSSAMPYPEDCP